MSWILSLYPPLHQNQSQKHHGWVFQILPSTSTMSFMLQISCPLKQCFLIRHKLANLAFYPRIKTICSTMVKPTWLNAIRLCRSYSTVWATSFPLYMRFLSLPFHPVKFDLSVLFPKELPNQSLLWEKIPVHTNWRKLWKEEGGSRSTTFERRGLYFKNSRKPLLYTSEQSCQLY